MLELIKRLLSVIIPGPEPTDEDITKLKAERDALKAECEQLRRQVQNQAAALDGLRTKVSELTNHIKLLRNRMTELYYERKK